MKTSRALTVACTVVIVAIGSVWTTHVDRCSANSPLGRVSISRCSEPPCILKKGTSITVEIAFTAQDAVSELSTYAKAKLAVFWLPFVGVHGTDACPSVRNLRTGNSGCPLVKGDQYLYENTFPIKTVYPQLATVVYWALQTNGGNTDLTCFQVDAEIQA